MTDKEVLQNVLNSRIPMTALGDIIMPSGSWTAAIRGAGTAGTYEIATQNCRYSRIGRRVWLDIFIIMSATVTGGGTSYLQITGVPFIKANNTLPQGAVYVDNVDYTGTANLTLSFTQISPSSVLYINETNDNAGAVALAVAGLSANDQIFASISYETDDA